MPMIPASALLNTEAEVAEYRTRARAAEARATKLQLHIDKYADHWKSCAYQKWDGDGAEPCDCGFSEARKALSTASE